MKIGLENSPSVFRGKTILSLTEGRPFVTESRSDGRIDIAGRTVGHEIPRGWDEEFQGTRSCKVFNQTGEE
jgi:hypothetical protein